MNFLKQANVAFKSAKELEKNLASVGITKNTFTGKKDAAAAPGAVPGAVPGQPGAVPGQPGAAPYGTPGAAPYGAPADPHAAQQVPAAYGAQQPQYGAQQPQYGAQQPQYGAPAAHGAVDAHGNPVQYDAHGNPVQQYGAPQQPGQYGSPPAAPAPYGATSPYASPPAQQQQQYGFPAAPYGTAEVPTHIRQSYEARKPEFEAQLATLKEAAWAAALDAAAKNTHADQQSAKTASPDYVLDALARLQEYISKFEK